MVEYFKIGQIINFHGIKGEIKVYPLTDNINRFSDLQNILLKENEEYKVVNIIGVKYINNFVILKLENIETIEDVKKYINQYIYIDRKYAVKLPQNTFFIADIIGINVYDISSMSELGKVISVLQTGKNDVYEIQKPDGNTFLIPAIDNFVKSIDINNKKMMINVIEGLL